VLRSSASLRLLWRIVLRAGAQKPEQKARLLRCCVFTVGPKGTAAKAMLANPHIGVTQIAHRLGASPVTLYRYIPAARTANLPGV
jgi:hypothetical protein